MLQKHDRAVVHGDYIVTDDDGPKGFDDYYTVADYVDNTEGIATSGCIIELYFYYRVVYF